MKNRKIIVDNIFRGLALVGLSLSAYNSSKSVNVKSIFNRLEVEWSKNEKLQKELDFLINQQKETIKNTREWIQQQADLKTKMDELNKSIEDLNTFKEKLSDITANNTSLTVENVDNLILKTEKLKSDIEKINEVYENMANFAKNTLNKTLDTANNLVNIDTSNFNFSIIERIQDFLSTLNFEQTLAFMHLSGSLIIAISVFSMVTIFYSEKLILYFKIEDKYPRFSKFIKLRSKFLHFYFLLDIFFILVTLIVFVYINLKILIYL